MMHILILPSWYPTQINPIAGIFFKEQAEALMNADIKVGVIYAEQRSLRTIRKGHLIDCRFQFTWSLENEIPVFRHHGWNLPKMKRMNRILWILFTKRLFKAYVLNFGKPDIIHAQSAIWAGICARELAAKYDIPYTITEHFSMFQKGNISSNNKKLANYAFGGAEIILSVSNGLDKAIQPFIKDKKSKIVPNIVNRAFFQVPVESKKKLYEFKFVVVAILNKNKGIDNLLRAFAMKFKGYLKVKLEVGGDGQERHRLVRLSQELGIKHQVSFLGSLSRREVIDTMQRANAFVLPSYSETFGVVLIEAMATGLPVIATRSGGPEDFVTPEVGALTTPGDVAELAAALQAVYDKREYWADQRMEISSYARERFSEKSVVSQLLNVYTDIMAKT